MESSEIHFNYRYLVSLAEQIGGRILDYGCGPGRAVGYGIDRGLDFWGTETFNWGNDQYEGNYDEWLDKARNRLELKAQDRIRPILKGQIADYPDNHFDCIISNQVVEHVADPEAFFYDIHRLLKKNGVLIATFPVTETWYEGHVGLYFAHNFRPRSSIRKAYLDLCYRLGFGLYRDQDRTSWVARSEEVLDRWCCYYPRKRINSAIERVFSGEIQDISGDYMRERFPTYAKFFPIYAEPLLRFVHHKRAGEVIKIVK